MIQIGRQLRRIPPSLNKCRTSTWPIDTPSRRSQLKKLCSGMAPQIVGLMWATINFLVESFPEQYFASSLQRICLEREMYLFRTRIDSQEKKLANVGLHSETVTTLPPTCHNSCPNRAPSYESTALNSSQSKRATWQRKWSYLWKRDARRRPLLQYPRGLELPTSKLLSGILDRFVTEESVSILSISSYHI